MEEEEGEVLGWGVGGVGAEATGAVVSGGGWCGLDVFGHWECGFWRGGCLLLDSVWFVA